MIVVQKSRHLKKCKEVFIQKENKNIVINNSSKNIVLEKTKRFLIGDNKIINFKSYQEVA